MGVMDKRDFSSRLSLKILSEPNCHVAKFVLRMLVHWDRKKYLDTTVCPSPVLGGAHDAHERTASRLWSGPHSKLAYVAA